MVQDLKSKDYESIIDRLSDPASVDLLHSAIGISTEGGELADNLKRTIFYGEDLDVGNLIAEAGDLLWYIQLALATVGSSLDEALIKNNLKLRKRYGDKFSEDAAINRNLEAEDSIFEQEEPETEDVEFIGKRFKADFTVKLNMEALDPDMTKEMLTVTPEDLVESFIELLEDEINDRMQTVIIHDVVVTDVAQKDLKDAG